ncbi:MAG: hypothetical protein K6T99_04570 [Armatimonadetes bacterium]|nr:hypothetical protein [Armatimonadota bacterium]
MITEPKLGGGNIEIPVDGNNIILYNSLRKSHLREEEEVNPQNSRTLRGSKALI